MPTFRSWESVQCSGGDTVVFPTFRQIIADAARREGFSAGRRSATQPVWRQRQRVRRFIEQIASIERQLGIYDLNKVTLAAPGAA